MNIFKLFLELLTSGAALVAIIAALASWYRSARRPLRIDRVVVHQKNEESTFILVLRNRKDYPITITLIDCYTRRHFTVQKKSSEPSEFQELLSLTDRVFSDSSGVELMPSANRDVRVKAGPFVRPLSKLLFVFETSHGYHQLWCRKILIVPIGVTEAYRLDYKQDFHSKLHALVFYFWARLREAAGCPMSKKR